MSVERQGGGCFAWEGRCGWNQRAGFGCSLKMVIFLLRDVISAMVIIRDFASEDMHDIRN